MYKIILKTIGIKKITRLLFNEVLTNLKVVSEKIIANSPIRKISNLCFE